MLLPIGGTFASAKYELKISSRIEVYKMIRVTFMPNGDDVVGNKTTAYTEPGGEVFLWEYKRQFTRQGYRMIRWNTEPDGTGDNYPVLDSDYDYWEYTFDKNTTLYAIWDPVIYFGITADGSDLTISDTPIDGFDWSISGERSDITWSGSGKIYGGIYLMDFYYGTPLWAYPTQRYEKSPLASSNLCKSDMNIEAITNVQVIGHVAPTSLAYLFKNTGCTIASVYHTNRFHMDLSGLDTSRAEDMRSMFEAAGSGGPLRFTDWSVGDLSDWNVSKVKDMNSMFKNAGTGALYWSVGDLSNWDVSNVTDMRYMFTNVGYSATSINLGEIKDWDVSSVQNMTKMFSSYGSSLTNCSLNLNGWNTNSLTKTAYMFDSTCENSETFSLDLRSFNMSKVTEMNNMFTNAGNNATDWTVIIPPTNGNGLANTSTRMYGANSSIYVDAPAGRSFTIAD